VPVRTSFRHLYLSFLPNCTSSPAHLSISPLALLSLLVCPSTEANPPTDGVDVTAKAITHRIAKLRLAINEEVDPKAPALGKPVIKPRKLGEKRSLPKEEVKAKTIVDDGYVILL